jgi:hypothetical protein
VGLLLLMMMMVAAALVLPQLLLLLQAGQPSQALWHRRCCWLLLARIAAAPALPGVLMLLQGYPLTLQHQYQGLPPPLLLLHAAAAPQQSLQALPLLLAAAEGLPQLHVRGHMFLCPGLMGLLLLGCVTHHPL